MSSLGYRRFGGRPSFLLDLGCMKKKRPANRTVFVGNRPPSTEDVFVPEKYIDNRVISSKYTLWNFLPKNLFEQFRRVANFYFLCVGIIQLLIDTPVTSITSILPLVFVISVTAIKQGYEDWLRHKADQEVNNTAAKVLRGSETEEIKSMHIKVGDIVKVEANEDFPCDLVMLSSSDPQGTCYITTANLDGETNLKTHMCVQDTRKYQKEQDLHDLEASIECQQPIPDLYRFIGRINIFKATGGGHVKPLGPENVLLRGARLKNTPYIYGCAIYTGQETKMALNSKFKQAKFSRVERAMNTFLIVFLLVLLFECILLTGLKYWYTATYPLAWYIPPRKDDPTAMHVIEDFLAFMVLLNYIVPISLYVTIEVQKFVGSMYFGWDMLMYDEATNEPAKANTSDLNEELGQVEFLFTDKTGTLTENYMQFRQCSINGVQYEEVGGQLYHRSQDGQPQVIHSLSGEVEEFFMVLALCHTVRVDRKAGSGVDVEGGAASSMYSDTGDEYLYQASSPDEKAFVEACSRHGIIYHGIHDDCMEITLNKEMRRYRVLQVLDFDPTRKRMSVILQSEQDKIVLLCKGAESAILDRVKIGEKDIAQKHVNEYAVLGLRTLAVVKRDLSEEEYKVFEEKLHEARTALQNREEKLDRVFDLIEQDFQLLGATAVEDKLQEDVPRTIQSLRRAGIKVWVLTGDKQETAVNISHSAGHFQAQMNELELTKMTKSEDCRLKIQHYRRQIESVPDQQYVLIIDGQSLSVMITELEGILMELCLHCVAVLCCRMSPIQKAQVVRMIKMSPTKPVTAAIGDGANDVSMIQEADVGIGIMGKEGRQAVRSSDYAFAKFKFLMRAFLIHGHYFYVRIATLVQYFFYKNIAFITCQLYYTFFSAFSEQPVYEALYLLLYNITFTSLPILIYGLFEKHLSQDTLLNRPELYRRITRNRKLSWRRFLLWNSLGLWQSVVIFFGTYLLFNNDVSLWPSGKSMGIWSYGSVMVLCCVFIVNIKLALETYCWSVPIMLSFGITFAGFFLVVIVYNFVFWPSWAMDHPYLLQVFTTLLACGTAWLAILLLCVTALLPDICLRVWHDTFKVQPAEMEASQMKLRKVKPVCQSNGVVTSNSKVTKLLKSSHKEVMELQSLDHLDSVNV
ncbi:phospholipid-transporting ATPase IF-like isoform X2 [Haliotis rubra]|uniref:phospholipid-transporting ATPase IF-like isoform X2 n=1 Tax=Haliotis rubra TaxID=36100 RepID=UPI001EE5E77D|nr:phospholipid-transporting ATPase IF-like isoform X2 [Haliotis rubra]